MNKCHSLTQKGKLCRNNIPKDCKKYCRLHSNCRKYLSEIIGNNIRQGKWSRKQSIAISFSQVKKEYSDCKKIFERSK
jgi:hypothetical protein